MILFEIFLNTVCNACKVMSFSRVCSPITFTLDESDLMRDVYDNVIDLIYYCEALKTFGFIMRLACDFHLCLLVKWLFCALVRPILEYGAIVWDHHTKDNPKQVKRVLILKIPESSIEHSVWFPWLYYPHFKCFQSWFTLGS